MSSYLVTDKMYNRLEYYSYLLSYIYENYKCVTFLPVNKLKTCNYTFFHVDGRIGRANTHQQDSKYQYIHPSEGLM